MKRKYAILIPKNFDVKKLNKDLSEINLEYIYYCIGCVISKSGNKLNDKTISGGKIETLNKENYFSIESPYIGRKHKIHTSSINLLIEDNYKINSSRSTYRYVNILDGKPYQIGKYKYSYRLSKKYYKKSTFRIEYLFDTKLIKQLSNSHTYIHPIVKTGQYKFLRKHFDPKKFKIDLDKAINICESRYKVHQDYNKYVNEMNQILNIYNGVYRIIYKNHSIDRLYTNITQLPKVYRETLSYNNKKFVEVDLSNSIIYILGNILYNLSSIINNNSLINNNEINSNLHMFSISLQRIDKEEVKLIFSLGLNGTFYDELIPYFDKHFDENKWSFYFQNIYNQKYTGDIDEKRKVSKKLIISMLFADVDQYIEIQKIFKEKFPTFLDLLNKYKTTDGHEKLSHLLFKVESFFVINVCAREFNKKYWRKAPIFTLHDCLITTEDYKDELINTMKKCFEDNLGNEPKLVSKVWE